MLKITPMAKQRALLFWILSFYSMFSYHPAEQCCPPRLGKGKHIAANPVKFFLTFAVGTVLLLGDSTRLMAYHSHNLFCTQGQNCSDADE